MIIEYKELPGNKKELAIKQLMGLLLEDKTYSLGDIAHDIRLLVDGFICPVCLRPDPNCICDEMLGKGARKTIMEEN